MDKKVNIDLKRIKAFLREDVWDRKLSEFSPLPAFLIRILRVFILMLRGIKDDELPIRASALTFVTLVSIIPMLSIALSVSSGLGFGEDVLSKISDFSRTQPEKVREMISQILTLVENTNFKSLGWIGVAFLIVTATFVLNGLEKTLNRIWGISTNRNMIRRVANYISLLVIIPISIGVAGTVHGMFLSGSSESLNFIQNFLLSLMPFISACIGLALLYATLPNARVGFWPALISGFMGALIWGVWQNAFISLQLSVAKYNAIYGTFAAVPIFLVWLHTSWIIILLGAEVAFAVQYHNTLHLERGAQGANVRVRQMLALSIMRESGVIFSKPRESFDKADYADSFKIPIRLVNDIIQLLVDAGFLVEISGKENNYALAFSPDKITIKNILDLVEEAGKGADDFDLDSIDPQILAELEKVDQGKEEYLGGRTLAELLKE